MNVDIPRQKHDFIFVYKFQQMSEMRIAKKGKNMKRPIALLVALSMIVVMAPLLFSCSKQKKDDEQELAASSGFYAFENYYFYFAKKTKNASKKTLKYAFFPNLEDEGIPVYSDAFGEGEDPFESAERCMILVDRDATEKNNGLPVLIIAYQIPKTIDGVKNYDYRLVSFDMGSNTLTVIEENIGAAVWEIALYGDTVYYTKFEGDIENVGESQSADASFGVYAISKKGGTTEKLQFPDKSFFSFKCAYKGKIYLESTTLEKAFCCAPDLSDPQPLPAFTSTSQPWKYSGGWLYYKTNTHNTEVDGVESEYFDLYRKPLDDMENADGELVLEKVQRLYGIDGNEIYYTGLSDVTVVSDFRGRPEIANNLVKWKDLASKKQGVVFDDRDNHTVHNCWLVTKDYYMISKLDVNDLNCEVYSRKTGEKRVIADLFWG